MTANSFTSVSLDPPLLLVCVGKSAQAMRLSPARGSLRSTSCTRARSDVSATFASKSTDKFDICQPRLRIHTGAPVLTDCLTWFDCTTFTARVDAGDHTSF
jgi:flavin reductase (DIM6/NTAB) family NADH-FMN oxidoreductase RutF